MLRTRVCVTIPAVPLYCAAVRRPSGMLYDACYALSRVRDISTVPLYCAAIRRPAVW
jgi:hypothetical protein